MIVIGQKTPYMMPLFLAKRYITNDKKQAGDASRKMGWR